MSKDASGLNEAGQHPAGSMARLIMDDWKRFLRTHGVPVKGVCRAAKRVIDLGAQAAAPAAPNPAPQVEALTTRVAELEAELARLRAERDAAPQS